MTEPVNWDAAAELFEAVREAHETRDDLHDRTADAREATEALRQAITEYQALNGTALKPRPEGESREDRIAELVRKLTR